MLRTSLQMPHTEVSPLRLEPRIPEERVVVAVILTWRGRFALFRRSQQLPHDGGRWHCITGFVEAGVRPSEQALDELLEETGLRPEDIVSLPPGHELTIDDEWDGHGWSIRTLLRQACGGLG